MPTLFCKDCKWFETTGRGCNEPNNLNLVTGNPQPSDCYRMRRKKGRCGPEAALFKLKEPDIKEK